MNFERLSEATFVAVAAQSNFSFARLGGWQFKNNSWTLSIATRPSDDFPQHCGLSR
jgi:hypothetical protein